MAVDMAPEPEADEMQEEEVLACAFQSWFHLFLGLGDLGFGLGFGLGLSAERMSPEGFSWTQGQLPGKT